MTRKGGVQNFRPQGGADTASAARPGERREEKSSGNMRLRHSGQYTAQTGHTNPGQSLHCHVTLHSGYFRGECFTYGADVTFRYRSLDSRVVREEITKRIMDSTN